MGDIKYCLIVSQYRHSYHTFIVKTPSDIATFKSCLLGVVEELEKYKRSSEDIRKTHYGDLEYLLDNSKEIFHSYNINDAGDIYIRNYNSINDLKDEAIYYESKIHTKNRGRIANYILEDISKHHNYNKIYEIIKKYFEIA